MDACMGVRPSSLDSRTLCTGSCDAASVPQESETKARPAFARPELTPHVGMLRRYLFVLGASAGRLDDLVQEVFVVTLAKNVEDRGEGPVGAFLRAVARNLLLRERRDAARCREVELADQVWHEQCGDDDGAARLAALRRCVAALPARSRDLLARCYGDGAGRNVVGAEFGMVANGVKTALRRVRAALRECVQRRLRGGA